MTYDRLTCQRCGGVVSWESDHWGRYLDCLMCGQTTDVDADGKPLEVSVDEPRMMYRKRDRGPNKP
jgi:hypothetical protein